jgi:hypothetical protein
MTVRPPPSDISCPPAESFEFASVTYTNVVLTDTTNDESKRVGDFSTGGLLPRVRGVCTPLWSARHSLSPLQGSERKRAPFRREATTTSRPSSIVSGCIH